MPLPLLFGAVDQTVGAEFSLYTYVRKISEWLYDAAVEVESWIIKAGFTELKITFNSGLVWKIWSKSTGVNNFKLSAKYYTGVEILFGDSAENSLFKGFSRIYIPLPKWALNPDFISWMTNLHIPGSENWQYIDQDTGVIKAGTEFDPVRYTTIADAWDNAKLWILVGFVIAVCWKLGLFKLAISFIKKCMGWVQSYRIRDTQETVKDIEDDLSDHNQYVSQALAHEGLELDNLDEVMTSNDQLMMDKLVAIGRRIGLRLSL